MELKSIGYLKNTKTFYYNHTKATKGWITHINNEWYQNLPQNLKDNFIEYNIYEK